MSNGCHINMKRKRSIAKIIAIITIVAFALTAMPLMDADCHVDAASKKPAKVKNLNVQGINNNTCVQLSWGKAKYAKKYQIYEKQSNGKYKRIKTLSKRKAVIKTTAGTHVYKVRGIRKGKKGKFSTAKTVILTVNYTDLGDYVIDLGTITAEDIKRGIAEMNRQQDAKSSVAQADIGETTSGYCTAIIKKNSKGQVIVGRNQDVEVSNYPVYISHMEGFGKYKAVSLFYANKGKYTYDQLRNGIVFDPDNRAAIAVASTDSFNEEGLYVQCNMRSAVGIVTKSSNPGKLRTAMITLSSLVSQNAATAEEAVNYIKNNIDVYTAGGNDLSWDYGYLIGDKTGRYCAVEFANNKMFVTWDKDKTCDGEGLKGHANYFVNTIIQPKDLYAAGKGRLDFALNSGYDRAETACDMMDVIHRADWYHEILDMKYSYKDEDGDVHFVNKNGGPSIDWRSELSLSIPVDDNGNVVLDESQIDIETLFKYKLRSTTEYVTDPANFEQVKQYALKRFAGDDELLIRFFNGDKQPLRDKGDVLTTGMNFGVNCSEKYMKVRFLEDENCIYEFQWNNGVLHMHKQ